jgi:GH15 family glucan-1,4-alpha-glucosidase
MATEPDSCPPHEYPLVARSIAVIKAGQAGSGAFVACPAYQTYNYAWFRDGTFTARALDLWEEPASADRFYRWACGLIATRVDAVDRCVRASAAGHQPAESDLLHTRYLLDGQPGSDDWPNFQLDGFGTLLWGIEQHLRHLGQTLGTSSPSWELSVRLLVRYLAALWPQPNFDCWEEFPDRIAVSTLAAVYAGLRSAEVMLGRDDPDGARAATAAEQLRALVFTSGVAQDHLIKQLGGDDAVDASLLWACTPFGRRGLLLATDPVMIATVRRIEADLVGSDGGVHRYRADTFYGGGQWVLLTALLGEYHAALGDAERARRCLKVVEAQADAGGLLPEQWSTGVLAPGRVHEWIDRWGPVAKPLLWSHAEYLSLQAAVRSVR